MKARIVAIAFPFLSLSLSISSAPAAELVEKIVARVNDRLITHSEFEKRVALASRAPQAPVDPAAVRREVLEEMIREKLLEERAKEMSVSATDEEVEIAVERVKRQYNLATDAEFDTALGTSNMTRDELKRQIRENITLQKVIGRDVTAKLEVSEDMLRLEYERQKETAYKLPEQAQVSEIVLRFSPSDPGGREKAVARLEEARAKLAAGAAFAAVAKEYSEGNARDRGGDLGWVSKGELLPALDVSVFSDPPQENTPPVLLPGSVHVFRVRARKPAGYRPFAEVSEDLKKRLSENLYEKRFGEFVEKLRREAFVKVYDPALAKAQEKKGA